MLLQKKQKQPDGTQAAALVAGVVIGAVAGAVLNDKKNRDKVIKVVNDAKTHVNGYVEDLKKATSEKKVADTKQPTKEIVEPTKTPDA